MSEQAKRTAFNFPASVRNAVAIHGTICPVCKTEPATELDHIIPINWATWAADYSIDMRAAENASWICGRCHFEKSRRENKISAALSASPCDVYKVLGQLHKHIKKYLALTFTPKGKRRAVSKRTIEKRIKDIRKIHKASMMRRKAKAAGNIEGADNLAKVRAARRRKARGIA